MGGAIGQSAVRRIIRLVRRRQSQRHLYRRRRLIAACPHNRGVKRTLIPGSLRVYPIENYGAVQMGQHRFDERGAATSTVAKFIKG